MEWSRSESITHVVCHTSVIHSFTPHCARFGSLNLTHIFVAFWLIEGCVQDYIETPSQNLDWVVVRDVNVLSGWGYLLDGNEDVWSLISRVQ